jgi:hypothetical protein
MTDTKAQRAYPKIKTNDAPVNAPIICSFLIGNTAWKKPDTFFQLEGWPMNSLQQLIGGKHSRDYEFHKMTDWNISTYGACAYSEKRATAIFLAPEGWNPTVQMDTGMAHYRGADVPQHWLKKELIRDNGSYLGPFFKQSASL